MAKRPSSERPPARRNFGFEKTLCEAITKKVLVRLRYDDDVAERLVAPYGVYRSTKDKYLLACTQIDNPEKPLDRWEPRNLEVGLMTSVSLTKSEFKPDTRFDPHDARYQNGFVCRI